ncbi:MAG TPA: NAD-dependent epimerase/dehydratase family protein, partial [Chloroflexota bacterium]|nr:NAD-dependent epimerase/dehydratase family protein [Chloroflexota bacterium]
MKTVLVTGVAGFIGSNLAEALLSLGYRVIGLDNLSQGSTQNIAGFLASPRFEFHRGDVRDSREVEGLIGRADCVMHLAAYKIPRYGNALDTIEINTQGTRNVLRSAAKLHRLVVFASTSDVYGRNPDVPFHEGSDLWMGPCNVPRWSYAISKMFDEHLCFAFQREFGL